MDTIVNYLEDTEKKLVKEMSDLFSKLREQRDVLALKGIEDMYTFKPLEGVEYEPYIKYKNNYTSSKSIHYYYAPYILPKDEQIICVDETNLRRYNDMYDIHVCTVLTNYGRVLLLESQPICVQSTQPNDIKILAPLPYKLPVWFYKAGCRPPQCTYYDQYTRNAMLTGFETFTNTIQELNKEFYLFAGKWHPHMTEHATLDIDKMRQCIIDNANCIQDLMEKNRELDEQNKKLQLELKEIKEQKTTLEKEHARLLPLEKYKEAVLDFMDNHYDGDEPYDNDETNDTAIVKYFSDWHFNKVYMDEWEYDDVIKSKEELNEYRIYKKVKGDLVSAGMDNSNVARNVRSIKKTINKHKS